MRIAPLLLLLAGCATSTSGVMNTAPGTYAISGKNTGVGATSDDVMAALYKQANQHCGAKGLAMQEVRSTARGAGLAQFPHGNLEFRCVPKGPG